MKDKILSLLNDQVSMEASASAEYINMASWCEVQGYKHAAEFLYEHAKEEREHMLKLMRYINDMGDHAVHPDIQNTVEEYKSLRAVFESILENEENVTEAIHAIVSTCLEEEDYATFNFMQWFVKEQREEELIAKRAIELFDVIGEDGVGLYMVDKEIGKLHQWAAAKVE